MNAFSSNIRGWCDNLYLMEGGELVEYYFEGRDNEGGHLYYRRGNYENSKVLFILDVKKGRPNPEAEYVELQMYKKRYSACEANTILEEESAEYTENITEYDEKNVDIEKIGEPIYIKLKDK